MALANSAKAFNFHRAKESQVSVHQARTGIEKATASMESNQKSLDAWAEKNGSELVIVEEFLQRGMLSLPRQHRLISNQAFALVMGSPRTQNRLAPNSRTWFLTSKSKAR